MTYALSANGKALLAATSGGETISPGSVVFVTLFAVSSGYQKSWESKWADNLLSCSLAAEGLSALCVGVSASGRSYLGCYQQPTPYLRKDKFVVIDRILKEGWTTLWTPSSLNDTA